MQYRSWLVFDIEHSHSIVVSLSLSAVCCELMTQINSSYTMWMHDLQGGQEG